MIMGAGVLVCMDLGVGMDVDIGVDVVAGVVHFFSGVREKHRQR